MKTLDGMRSLIGLRRALIDMPRYYKRTLLVVLDFIVLCAILWSVISLRHGIAYVPDNWLAALVLLSGPVLILISFAYAGLYRLVTRYLGSLGHARIVGAVVLAGLVWALSSSCSGSRAFPAQSSFRSSRCPRWLSRCPGT